MSTKLPDNEEIKKLLEFIPDYFEMCANNKITDIKDSLEKFKDKNLSVGHARGIMNACQYGHLEMAKYIESISPPEAFTSEKIDDMVSMGAHGGHYNIVSYYSNHPKYPFIPKNPQELLKNALTGANPEIFHLLANKYHLQEYLQPYMILRLAVKEKYTRNDNTAAKDTMISILAAQYDVRKPTKEDIAFLKDDEVKPDKAAFKKINEIYKVIRFKKKLEKDLPIQGVQHKRTKI